MFEKSESIKAGLRQSFQDGSSKMARRKWYEYMVSSAGELVINPGEAKVVAWIFERHLVGDSLEKITAGLKQQDILSPTGKSKWNQEAIDKLLSNEKYTNCKIRAEEIIFSELFTVKTGVSSFSCIPIRDGGERTSFPQKFNHIY